MNHSQQSYSGGAFHPDLPKGRATGTVTVTHMGIQFAGDNCRIELPFDAMRIKRGGASNRLIFFENSTLDDWSVYTSDSDILKNPLLHRKIDILHQIDGIRRQKLKRWGITIVVIAAIFSAIGSLYFVKEPLVRTVAEKVPVAWEEKLGDTVFQQLVGGRHLIEKESATRQLELITGPLLDAISDTEYNFRFHIIEDPMVNAFAIPGGHVVIHTGLLIEAESAEEVAGVLAHEISHVTERHSLRQLIGASGIYLVVQSLIGDISGLLAVLADNGAFLLTRSFSRNYEREADETGWSYLLKAGIDPSGVIAFFKKLKLIEEEQSKDMPGQEILKQLDFLSTHPATDERIAYLEEKLANLDPGLRFKSLPIDFPRFQDTIRSLTMKSKIDMEADQEHEIGN